MYFIMNGKWAFAKKILNIEELMLKDPHILENEDKVITIKGNHYLVLRDHEKRTYIGEYYILT